MIKLFQTSVVLVGLAVASLTSAEDRFFDSNGVRLRYVDQGTGDPVVLLHGAGGRLESWTDSGVFAQLVVDHRVIAFDARGHGKSGKPHDPQAYIGEPARDVVRLLDHLSISKAHIVGYSMGAVTVSQLLTLYPERALTATLTVQAGWFELSDEQRRMFLQIADEREKECVSRTLIYELAPPDRPKPTEQEILQRSRACLADPTQDRFAQAAMARAGALGSGVVSGKDAALVSVPTLGIGGTLDAPNLERLRALKSLRPSMDLVVIDGAVHGSADPRGVMRHPIFISSLRAFLSAHPLNAKR